MSTKPTRVFLKTSTGTILDVQGCTYTHNGEHLLGRVSNGNTYKIELIDEVMFMTEAPTTTALEGVKIVYEGNPPGHNERTSSRLAAKWVSDHLAANTKARVEKYELEATA